MIITACFCCLLWGSAHTCIKVGYQMFSITSDNTAGQILFAGTRFFLAGVMVILASVIPNRKLMLPSRATAGPILTLALFQTIIQYVFFYFGLARASAARSSVISGTTSFVSIIIAVAIFRSEKLTFRKVLACMLGFAGVLIMEMGGTGLDFGFSMIGEGFVMLSVFSSSFAANLLKEYSKVHDPVLLSGYQFMAGGAAMMIYGFAMGGRMISDSPYAPLLILYMAFISSAAYTFWGILLKYNPVSSVTIFTFVTPIIGVFISAIILNDIQAISIYTLVALALVCAGIILVSLQKDPH